MGVGGEIWTISSVSQIAARILSVGIGIYAVGSGLYTHRAFEARLEDRFSALVSTLVLATLAMLMWLQGAMILPAPFSVGLIVVYASAVLFTLTYTLGRYQERIEHFRQRFGQRLQALLADRLPEDRFEAWLQFRQKMQWSHEERRKLPHLLMGVFVAIYTFFGYLILQGIWRFGYGADTTGTGEGVANLQAILDAGWLPSGQVFGLFGLFTLLFTLMPTELLRLKFPELGYPFKQVILSRLRSREAGLFGAHVYITAALTLVAAWLARDPAAWERTIYAFVALLCVTVFADAASALVGVRSGKRKWFHNPGKSYMGSFGGTVVAFLVALPFVGVPMAVASAAAFLVVDIIGPVPVPISDNLLNPLVLAATYTVLEGHLDPMLPFY